jgi:hypothetical protein
MPIALVCLLLLFTGLPQVTHGQTLSPHMRYRAYVERCQPITQRLVALEEKLTGLERNLNLQQLSAWSHVLTLERTALHASTDEQQLYSYRLINEAVNALTQAATDWQQDNTQRFQAGKLLDNVPPERLRIHVQNALNRIQDLKELNALRLKLGRQL